MEVLYILKTITAYFVRHGQTMLNRYNKVQGWIDSPLTDKGINDAISAGNRLKDIKFSAGFSSDSGRAIKTLKLLLKQNPENIHLISYQFSELREMCHGYFEGTDLSQMWQFVGEQVQTTTESGIMKRFGLERARDLIHKADLYGDAEDNDMFWKRLNRGFDQLLENSKDQDNIVVVSHGNTIRSIISKYAPQLDKDYPTRNGSVTKIILSDTNSPKVIYYDNLDELQS